VHRLSRKKKSAHAKPRPVIARFVSYQKRNEFMYAKKKFKEKQKTKRSIHYSSEI